MVRQATNLDIPIIEGILLDAVRWLDASDLHLWEVSQVSWESLLKNFKAEDFYIAFRDGCPAACMSIIDYDPGFWPDISKGEALFLHKIAVVRKYAGQGLLGEMVDFAKNKAKDADIRTIRLDCHRYRDKLRLAYEKQGFVCVAEERLFGWCETAFYVCEVAL